MEANWSLSLMVAYAFLVYTIPVHRVNFIVRSMLQNYTALLKMLEIVLLLWWHVEYSVRKLMFASDSLQVHLAETAVKIASY